MLFSLRQQATGRWLGGRVMGMGLYAVAGGFVVATSLASFAVFVSPNQGTRWWSSPDGATAAGVGQMEQLTFNIRGPDTIPMANFIRDLDAYHIGYRVSDFGLIQVVVPARQVRLPSRPGPLAPPIADVSTTEKRRPGGGALLR
jgi:hypothetical protein